MAKQDPFNTFELDREMVSLKTEESSLLKELQRVVDFFNRVLFLKEKLRVALMERIISSEQIRNSNFDKLKKLIRNIEIYKKNMEQIEEKQAVVVRRESWLKAKYEELLQGSAISNPFSSMADEKSEDFGDLFQVLLTINQDIKKIAHGSSSNREQLMKCREEYLVGLQKIFKKLDQELADIEKEKEKLKNFGYEIKRKQDKAQKQEIILKKNYDLLVGDIKKKKVDLEVSTQEERALIFQYRGLMEGLRSDIKITGELEEFMDRILSSSEYSGPLGTDSPSVAALDKRDETGYA